MYNWTGPRVTLGIGVTVAAGLLALAACISEVYWAVAVFAIAEGLGPGLLFLPLMFCSWTALPDNKGLAAGLTSFCFCLGGTLYGLLFTFLINPNNDSPSLPVTSGTQMEHLFPPSMVHKVPSVFLWSAIAGAVLSAFALVLIYDPTSRSERQSIAASIVSRESLKQPLDTSGCPTLYRALQTSALWMLFAILGLSITFPSFMLSQYKNYGEKHIDNDQYLSGIGSAGLIFNASGRLICTWLTDFLSYKPVALSICLTMGVAAFTVTYIAQYHVLYVVWVLVALFGQGSVFMPLGIVCRNIYGPVVGGKVFSLVILGSAVANTLLAAGTVPMVQVLGYEWTFRICGFSALAAALLVVFVRTKYNWEKTDSEALL